MCYYGQMTSQSAYAFRLATLDDLDMLSAWQATPHVRAWWDTDAPYDAADLADHRVQRWIVSLSDRPFAYLQDYTVHGWKDHHFAHLPPGTRGIDQYIGDPEMVGIGHGPGFISARLKSLFDQGAPVIATDPHPDNRHAISAYQKAGFEAAGTPQMTKWGLILPMVAAPSAAVTQATSCSH